MIDNKNCYVNILFVNVIAIGKGKEKKGSKGPDRTDDKIAGGNICVKYSCYFHLRITYYEIT